MVTGRKVVRSAVLLVSGILIAAAWGCGAETAEPSAAPDAPATSGTSGEQRPASDKRMLTAETLPTAVGTTWEIASYEGEVAADVTVEGPWTFEAGTDWRRGEREIVDPTTVPGIEQFADVTFVTREVNEGATYYYPRKVTGEWVQHLGKVEVTETKTTPEPLPKPSNFWPLGFEVGDEYLVQDEGTFRIDATVLSVNTATTPAGQIDDTYLVRFVYTPQADTAKGSTYYYMFAPDVGMVALFHPATGSEEAGFTAIEDVSVISRLPG